MGAEVKSTSGFHPNFISGPKDIAPLNKGRGSSSTLGFAKESTV